MKKRHLHILVLIGLFLLKSGEMAMAQNTYTINTENIVHTVDEKVYGHFLEHIFFSVNGGLWGELVWNRSLERVEGAAGNWEIEDTVITQSALSENVRLLFGDTDWEDYEITLKAKKLGGYEGFLILFRANAENFYWFNIAGWNNTQHAIEKGTPGVRWSVFNGLTSAGSINTGEWYDIKVRCEGNHFQTWINESLIFDFTDDNPHLAGQAGIGTWRTEAQYTDILVTEIPSGDTLFMGLPNLGEDAEAGFLNWEKVGNPELYKDKDALNSDLCARIINQQAGEAGLEQGEFYFQDQMYYGSFWARGESPEGMTVRMLNNNDTLAQDTFPAPTEEWQEFSFELNPGFETTDGRLQVLMNDTGNVYLDQISLVGQDALDNQGFRPDLLEAVEGLRPPIIRWPGGCYVSAYFWKDGIGPQHERGSYQMELWDDKDVNSYGTDEFLQMCELIGAEPLIVINSGILDVTCGVGIPVQLEPGQYLQDALDWIEYCNGDAETTTWGAVRAANGHPEPYNVKYWEIDNEVWVAGVSNYVDLVQEFAPAMRAKDPDIKIIACGSSAFDQNWNTALLNGCAEDFDYISTHHYEDIGNYRSGVLAYENFLKTLSNNIASSSNPGIKIYMSEWNVWSPIDWRCGLYAGGMLNTFERQGDYFKIGGPALFLRHDAAGTSWNNAFINFDNSDWFPAPNYVVMKLWRDYYSPNFVEMSGIYNNLNAVATISPDSSLLYFKLVNTTAENQEVILDIDPSFEAGNVYLKTVTAPGLTSVNSFANPNNITVHEGRGFVVEGEAHFTSPAYSAMVVIVDQNPPMELEYDENTGFNLFRNRPNPFNEETLIKYTIPEAGEVQLRVLDVSGNTISVLENEKKEPGTYEAIWNGRNDAGYKMSSGIYFYELKTSRNRTLKMMSLLP